MRGTGMDLQDIFGLSQRAPQSNRSQRNLTGQAGITEFIIVPRLNALLCPSELNWVNRKGTPEPSQRQINLPELRGKRRMQRGSFCTSGKVIVC